MTELYDILANGNPNDPTSRIVRLLAQKGSLSAAQIATMTGLAKSTVSVALGQLRNSETVIPSSGPNETSKNAVGRPRASLSLNPQAGTCVGVQLLPQSIRTVVADVSHTVLAEREQQVGRDFSPEIACEAVGQMIDEIYGGLGLDRNTLLGIGVAFPGPVRPADGVIVRSSVLPDWEGLQMAKVFEAGLPYKVFGGNESNCSAIAEMTWGAAKGTNDFIFLKIDLGIGGAIVVDGRVYEGISGGGGEFGHISLDPKGALCRCGNRGCLELIGSLIPVMDIARKRFGEDLTVDEFIEHVVSGDAGCQRLVEDVADTVGTALAAVGTIFNPPLIVIGGRAAKLGSIYFDNLTRMYERHTLIKRRDMPPEFQTQIVPGTFAGNDSSLGAIGLVLQGTN
jgi:predicted NBD/HSP70 family sugar kinase